MVTAFAILAMFYIYIFLRILSSFLSLVLSVVHFPLTIFLFRFFLFLEHYHLFFIVASAALGGSFPPHRISCFYCLFFISFFWEHYHLFFIVASAALGGSFPPHRITEAASPFPTSALKWKGHKIKRQKIRFYVKVSTRNVQITSPQKRPYRSPKLNLENFKNTNCPPKPAENYLIDRFWALVSVFFFGHCYI